MINSSALADFLVNIADCPVVRWGFLWSTPNYFAWVLPSQNTNDSDGLLIFTAVDPRPPFSGCQSPP